MYWIEYDSKTSRSSLEQEIHDYARLSNCKISNAQHRSDTSSDLGIGVVCRATSPDIRITSSAPGKGRVCRSITVFFVEVKF